MLPRRRVLSLLAATALVAACSGEATGPGTEAPAAHTFKIGAVLPLSGQTATYGEESLNGLRMAIDDHKAAGGEPVELIFKDNKGDSTETAKLVSQLIKIDQVDMLIGSVASTNTLKGAKVAQENGVPMMTPSSTNASITDRGEYISRVCFIDPVQGAVLAKLAVNDLGKKKAAIVIDKASDYSVGLAEAFRATLLAGGGEVVSDEVFTAGEVDFSAIITKVAESGADVIFLPDYYGDVGPMLKQAGDKWASIPVIAGDGIDSPDLYPLMGDYKGDLYMSTHFAPDDTDPKVQGFVNRYKDRYGKIPGSMAALGYDAGLAVFDAHKRAVDDTHAALKDAINSIKNLEGITGSITVNAQRNADKDVVILKVSPAGAVFFKRIPSGG